MSGPTPANFLVHATVVDSQVRAPSLTSNWLRPANRVVVVIAAVVVVVVSIY